MAKKKIIWREMNAEERAAYRKRKARKEAPTKKVRRAIKRTKALREQTLDGALGTVVAARVALSIALKALEIEAKRAGLL